MKNTKFILKGNLLWAPRPDVLSVQENGYLVAENGRIQGVYAALPADCAGLPVVDYGQRLIIPGLVDLHLHAPQYTFRGTGMDLELLDWLNTYTFPEEARYADLAYARTAYGFFVQALTRGATTRASIFATLHTPATLLLMDLLEDSGLVTLVGRVNMDRNSPDSLREADAATSLRETRAWLADCQKYSRTRPILTPRFVPSCTDELLAGLGQLQQETGLPVQSHLSENPSEVAWVKELCPDALNYGDAYTRAGLFGGPGVPTIMAHCVYSSPAEVEQLRSRRVFVAHCPQSNTNLASGIAPVRAYLQAGLQVGLGTDVAGGASANMLRAICDAIQVSKLRWRLVDNTARPLGLSEAFYLATKGGGAFWGQVGSFEPGYELDAVVLDDSSLPLARPMSPAERLERIIYLGDERHVAAKYVAGQRLFISEP